jgi:hypothetical protein
MELLKDIKDFVVRAVYGLVYIVLERAGIVLAEIFYYLDKRKK